MGYGVRLVPVIYFGPTELPTPIVAVVVVVVVAVVVVVGMVIVTALVVAGAVVAVAVVSLLSQVCDCGMSCGRSSGCARGLYMQCDLPAIYTKPLSRPPTRGFAGGPLRQNAATALSHLNNENSLCSPANKHGETNRQQRLQRRTPRYTAVTRRPDATQHPA